MRKTIEVSFLLEKGNYFLEHSEPELAEQRKGVASMIELALHEAGAYKGFSYLASAKLKNNPTYNEAWDEYREGKRDFMPRWDDFCRDDTRRMYYVHPRLRYDRRTIKTEA